ncbi:MAG TPA: purine-nucleoside phosphorylase, partial [Gemmatimonadales bacterium]|nr:purine-nucleoside phosphorylase [Gemmatimonadales bacterium]
MNSGSAGQRVGEPVDVVAAAAAAVRARLGDRTPEIAIVLGSGLGLFTERIQNAVVIPYAEIPGFPLPTVEGHRGELVAGRLAGREVIAQSGRFHLYEGHSATTAALPVRLFARLGVNALVLTNAAGGIRRTFAAGTLMLITDHINFMFRNPLIGSVSPGETRFPDMSAAYDRELRMHATAVAGEVGIRLEEGVYAAVLGPSYETPAEIRMLERLGADAVGMSTVPEVIVARALDIRCLAISTITNPAAGITTQALHHGEVVEIANRVGRQLGDLIQGIVAGA